MKLDFGLLVATIIVMTVTVVSAQDPVKLSPSMYTVLLDNEHVRILEFRCKSGEKEPLHSHPAMVAYSLTSAKAISRPEGGDSIAIDSRAGTAVWMEPVTHSWECIAPREQRTILVEMKEHAKHMADMSKPN